MSPTQQRNQRLALLGIAALAVLTVVGIILVGHIGPPKLPVK